MSPRQWFFPPAASEKYSSTFVRYYYSTVQDKIIACTVKAIPLIIPIFANALDDAKMTRAYLLCYSGCNIGDPIAL
jgi:hypothetical protein